MDQLRIFKLPKKLFSSCWHKEFQVDSHQRDPNSQMSQRCRRRPKSQQQHYHHLQHQPNQEFLLWKNLSRMELSISIVPLNLIRLKAWTLNMLKTFRVMEVPENHCIRLTSFMFEEKATFWGEETQRSIFVGRQFGLSHRLNLWKLSMLLCIASQREKIKGIQ